jgi:S-adenosylmethionine/arginine decarboxylase-like enzyme
MSDYWGYHLVLDCGQCDAGKMKDFDTVDTWIRKLVKDIDMEPIGEPRIEYTAAEFPNKAGFTVVQVIVTSSITAHFVDNLGQIYLDVFSCKPFAPEVVERSMQETFGCNKFRKYYLTRQAD